MTARIAALPDPPAARRLFRAMRYDCDVLFHVITRRDLAYTDNAASGRCGLR
ncbi:MAG: hypothetical protein ACP5NP_11755 [Acetobacteraceae bacterium]